MGQKEELIVLSTRIPKRMDVLIDNYLRLDTHANKSDFLRDAIREKIKTDAPHLYKELFFDQNQKG